MRRRWKGKGESTSVNMGLNKNQITNLIKSCMLDVVVADVANVKGLVGREGSWIKLASKVEGKRLKGQGMGLNHISFG